MNASHSMNVPPILRRLTLACLICLLPPMFGGAVMGLCAAIAMLVLRDIRRSRRRPQSLASASV